MLRNRIVPTMPRHHRKRIIDKSMREKQENLFAVSFCSKTAVDPTDGTHRGERVKSLE